MMWVIFLVGLLIMVFYSAEVVGGLTTLHEDTRRDKC